MQRIIFLPLILICVAGAFVKAQNITTVAGTGTSGYNGDGIAAITAQLTTPTGVVLDAFGNLYIADAGRVRKVDAATGIITTVAGNGTGYNGDGIPATTALMYPAGIALDDSGNIYIADWANERIRKVTVSTGIINTVAGNGIHGYSGDNIQATSAELAYPYDVAIGDSGNIFIADFQNDRVRKVTVSTGVISTVAGNGLGGYNGDNIAASSAKLFRPSGVATDAYGNIFIGDFSNNRIRKVNAAGIITTVAGTGTQGYNGDNITAVTAQLNHPLGVAVDASGNIFFAEYNGNRIREVTATDSMITTLAGDGTAAYNGDNIPATTAQVNTPWDVTIDAYGNIYIADTYNNRIRKIINISTGVSESSQATQDIIVYPNPTASQFSISGYGLPGKTEIEIYNALGEKIIEQSGFTEINLSDYPDGVYFVSLRNNEQTITKKIMLLK